MKLYMSRINGDVKVVGAVILGDTLSDREPQEDMTPLSGSGSL